MSKRTGEEEAPVWAQMAGEPGKWYARFETYRLLGPHRSIRAAYRQRRAQDGLGGAQAGSAWFSAARKWSWQERAEAWDKVERERLRVEERERRKQAHEQRAEMIDVLLKVVFQTMRRAKLEGIETEQARQLLPTIRMLFRDLLTAQRAELGAADEPAEGEDQVVFTADELLAAQRELAAWQECMLPDIEEDEAEPVEE